MMFSQKTYLNFYWILSINALSIGYLNASFNCSIPDGCRLEKDFQREYFEFNVRGKIKRFFILCDIKSDDFEFKFRKGKLGGCNLNKDIENRQKIIFRWKSSSELRIFDQRFNFTNAIRYFRHFVDFIALYIYGLNGFDFNIVDKGMDSRLLLRVKRKMSLKIF